MATLWTEADRTIERRCLHCDEAFQITPSSRLYGRGKFCSFPCASSHRFDNGSRKTAQDGKGRRAVEDREWRKAVFARDNFTCRDCGEVGGGICAHHIVSFAEDVDLRYELENGLTLCCDCHAERHPRYRHLILANKDNPCGAVVIFDPRQEECKETLFDLEGTG